MGRAGWKKKFLVGVRGGLGASAFLILILLINSKVVCLYCGRIVNSK